MNYLDTISILSRLSKSEEFKEAGRVARHRIINRLLEDELRGPVHALAIHAYTREDWEERFGHAPMSPPCLGGDS